MKTNTQRFESLRRKAFEKASKVVSRLESIEHTIPSVAELNQIVKVNVLLDYAIAETTKLTGFKYPPKKGL